MRFQAPRGANDVLPKPIDSNELAVRLQLHIRKASERRHLCEQSYVDELTGVYNRRGAMQALERELNHVDDIDAVSRKVREDFLPIVRTVPGFVAYYLVDATHSTFSITICQDEAGVEEAIARASEWTKNNLGGLVESPPEIIQGEVVVENLV